MGKSHSISKEQLDLVTALVDLTKLSDGDIVTFKEVEDNLGITQSQLFNRLYISYKDLTPPQCDLDNYRQYYKLLCTSSGVNKYPGKKKKSGKKDKTVTSKKKTKVTKSKEVVYDATQQESFDNRSIGNVIRDESGNISNYRFKVLIRDKEPFSGELSLSEMQNIYIGYSNRGYNLSARKLCEQFPQFDLVQLKKILRAFQITKDCYPFAPHIVEQCTQEELENKLNTLKCHAASKKSDKDEIKTKDKYIAELSQQIKELKEEKLQFNSYINDCNITLNTPSIRHEVKSDKSLILYISDWHIGSYISKNSLFYHPYDLDEIKLRINRIIEPFTRFVFDDIVVVNLGDSVDGYNKATGRGGHELPQIGDGNKEIYKWFMEAMAYLFSSINLNIKHNSISYYAVGESNHGADFEWVCQKSLENWLISEYWDRINELKIFDTTYGTFKVNGENFLVTHGKDNLNMFRNLPLTVAKNPDTELFILKLLDKFKFDKAHFIKGDLHQSATSFGYRFRYRSVGCMIGSTEWSGANFGDTDAYCDYDIINKRGDILEGRIKLNW